MNYFRCGGPAAMFFALLNCARAADWYTGSPSKNDASYGASIDSSLSATSQGDLYLAMTGAIAPFEKLDESGLRIGVGGDLGRYSYISQAAGIGRVRGREEDGSLLVGWLWNVDAVKISAYVGPAARNDALSRFDPDNPQTKDEVGVKTSGDFYANPTPYTMAFGQASYSSVRRAYYTHFKFGFAIADHVFVGPEAQILGDEFYRQRRIGAHVSGVALGSLQLGASGGVLEDHARGRGAYGSLNMRLAF